MKPSGPSAFLPRQPPSHSWSSFCSDLAPREKFGYFDPLSREPIALTVR